MAAYGELSMAAVRQWVRADSMGAPNRFRAPIRQRRPWFSPPQQRVRAVIYDYRTAAAAR